MRVDGIRASVGSTDLDHRSLTLNDELNDVVYDADVARRLEGPRRITRERLRRRSWFGRFLAFVTASFRRQL